MAYFHFVRTNDDVVMGFSVFDHNPLATLNGSDYVYAFHVCIFCSVTNKSRGF